MKNSNEARMKSPKITMVIFGGSPRITRFVDIGTISRLQESEGESGVQLDVVAVRVYCVTTLSTKSAAQTIHVCMLMSTYRLQC